MTACELSLSGVSPEVATLAVDAALFYRERTKGPKIVPTKVTVFCLPEDNEIDHSLVLKVHGEGSVLGIVAKPKGDRMGGLFDCPEDREEVRDIFTGEDWVLVYGRDFPSWAVAQVLIDAHREERAA